MKATWRASKTPSWHQKILLLMLPLSVFVFVAGVNPARGFVVDKLLMDLFRQVVEVLTDKNFGIERWLDLLSNPCNERFPWDEQICGAGADVDGNGVINVSDVFKQSTGDVGIPDPNQTRQKTQQQIKDAVGSGQADVFEINPIVYAAYAANQLDRLNTRGSIETVLGNSGQKQIKKQLDAVADTTKDIAKTANESQSLDVTQDVMKKQAKIFAQQSLLLAGIRADGLTARTDAQFTNLNLMNVSRTMDEIARRERVSASANAMYLVEISGLARLN